MASPPFSIAETVPADSNLASQFPATERTFRDTVESWLLVNHNVNGRHDEVQLDYKADPGSGTASVTEIWASSTGNAAGALKMRHGTGNVEYVGVPPGTIVDYGGTTAPEGWLLCYGQAISRTTYVRLFDVLSTSFGSGDGSTTFNVPDLRGRVGAGKDDMGGTAAGRISNIMTGTLLGNNGGAERHTLSVSELPSHSHGVNDPGHSHGFDTSINWGGATFVTIVGGGGAAVPSSAGIIDIANATTGISIQSTGSSGPHTNLQPTLIVNKIIKT